MEQDKIDKNAVKVFNIKQQNSDVSYWRSQSYYSRLEALELIRSEYHKWRGYDHRRFQRIYRVIKPEQG